MRSSSLSSATMQGSQNGSYWVHSVGTARAASPRVGLSESDPSHLPFEFERDEGSKRHPFVSRFRMDEGDSLAPSGGDDQPVKGIVSPRINHPDDSIDLSGLISVPVRRFHMKQEEDSPKIGSRQSSERCDIFESESEKRPWFLSDFHECRRSNSLDGVIPNRDPTQSELTGKTSFLHSDADDENDDDDDSILSVLDVHLDEKDFDVSSLEELDRPNVPSSSSSGAMQSSSSSRAMQSSRKKKKYLPRRPQVARFSMQANGPVRRPLSSSSSGAAAAAASSYRDRAGAASPPSVRNGKTVRSNGAARPKRQKKQDTEGASAYDGAGAALPCSIRNGKTVRFIGAVEPKRHEGLPDTSDPIPTLALMEKPTRKKSSRAAVIPEPPVGMGASWCHPSGNHGRPRKVDTEADDSAACRDNRCGRKHSSHMEARACEFSHVLWQYQQMPLDDLTCHVVGWKGKTKLCATECKTLKAAKDHFNKVHGYRSEGCPVCKKRFREPNLLRDHLKAAITRYNAARGIVVPPAPAESEQQPSEPHQLDDDQPSGEPAARKPRKKRQNAKEIQARIEEERRERQKKKQDGDEGRRWRLIRREGAAAAALEPVPSQQVSEEGGRGKPSKKSKKESPSEETSSDETR